MAEEKTLVDKKLMVVEFRKICNPENEHITMYYGEDVKEAVLKFEEVLLSYYGDDNVPTKEYFEIIEKYYEIIGDFNNK